MPWSVNSRETTASAPEGMGAPDAMRIAVPGTRAAGSTAPARISLTVTDANGVSVARRQVGDREVEGGLHVLCEHAADRISELNVERRQRVSNGHAVLVEVGNASHSC